LHEKAELDSQVLRQVTNCIRDNHVSISEAHTSISKLHDTLPEQGKLAEQQLFNTNFTCKWRCRSNSTYKRQKYS